MRFITRPGVGPVCSAFCNVLSLFGVVFLVRCVSLLNTQYI